MLVTLLAIAFYNSAKVDLDKSIPSTGLVSSSEWRASSSSFSFSNLAFISLIIRNFHSSDRISYSSGDGPIIASELLLSPSKSSLADYHDALIVSTI